MLSDTSLGLQGCAIGITPSPIAPSPVLPRYPKGGDAQLPLDLVTLINGLRSGVYAVCKKELRECASTHSYRSR